MTTSAYFTNIRSEIIALLNNAKKEILISMAWFTNEELFEACIDCLKRDVKVKLVLLDDLINHCTFGVDFNLFINLPGSEFYLYPQIDKFLHHKFCIIDEKILITGSYNWTNYAEIRNLENIIVCDDPSIIKDYQKCFNNLIKNLEQTKEFGRIEPSDIQEREFKGRIVDIAQEIYSLSKSKANYQGYRNQLEDKLKITHTKLPKSIHSLENNIVIPESFKEEDTKEEITLNKISDFKYSISKVNIGFKANLKDQGGKEGLKVMIKKGQELPYTISCDAQSFNSGEAESMTAGCEFYYGDSIEIYKCTKFGETLTLTDLPKMKEGEVKFKIKMTLEETGKLSAKFVCVNTGKGLESTTNNPSFIDHIFS